MGDQVKVRFFGKIQDWIPDPRSYRFFESKEMKNPEMDFVIVRDSPRMQFALLAAVLKMAASLLFPEFYEIFPANMKT